MNYFEFYGIPESFYDEKGFKLKRRYLELSRKYHPDFHTDTIGGVKDIAEDYSALNNNAYETLKNFDKRLKYILELNGYLGQEGSKEALPPAFLMEMMEINEALMELEFDFNAEQLSEIKSKVDTEIAELNNSIKDIVVNYKKGDKTILENSRLYLFKKRYITRILEKISNLQLDD